MTADPYRANNGGSGDLADPGSCNRYVYVEGDPIYLSDPEGLFTQMCSPGEIRVKNVGCVMVMSPLMSSLIGVPAVGVKSVKEYDDEHPDAEMARWDGLSAACQRGLTDALPGNMSE
jgi:hypothetical protein